DELPVRVTDEVACTLLNNLILDAAEVARGGGVKVRWNVRLAPIADRDWGLEGNLQVPSALEAADFNSLFGRRHDTETPTRFEFLLRVADAAPQVVALGTRREDGGKGRHLGLELLPQARAASAGGLDRERVLIARSRSEMLTTIQFPGAEGLTDLPWIFVPE